MSSLADRVDLVIGVDTHKHTHTAAVVTAATGAVVASTTTATTRAGLEELLAWSRQRPGALAWAIEGAGSYGTGLAQVLAAAGAEAYELDRPTRTRRRAGAKTDTIDAIRAAREALAREHLTRIKDTGHRAELAALITARRSAVQGAGGATRALHALVITAPGPLREHLQAPTTSAMITTATRLRPHPTWDRATSTIASVARALARRITTLTSEARAHEHAITQIVTAWRPDLLTGIGIGPIVAAQILIAWSHPGRIRSEAAFAMLSGTAPIPASSGMTTRHRLNRSGDRQLNRALHTITLTRARHDPRTRDYIERRRAQGKTDREIRRCLKRYIARDLFRQLEHPTTPLDAS